MRILKMTWMKGEIFLYPVPVVRENKYLIRCSSEVYAKTLIKLIELQWITHPDEKSDYFIFDSLHTDGETEIFQLNLKVLLVHLPRREIDLDRALKLEEILTKKIITLMSSHQNDLATAQAELIRRYESQTSCSECIKLGIQEISEGIYSFNAL